MKISVIGGTGYVGLCTGIGFSSRGEDVILVARNPEKIEKINQGIPIIFEAGLEDALKKSLQEGKVRATSDMKAAVMGSDVSFICVGTPSGEDGRIDLRDMESACRGIGEALREKGYHVIAVKSTVVPGTTEKMAKIIEDVSGKNAGADFGICMNPEFLREGTALQDFLNPDRIVIGEIDKRSGDIIEGLYRGFNSRILRTNLKTAEMIKYASNSLLAAKVSFVNDIGNICKLMGIDVYDVMEGVGLDHRISPKFLRAGCGFGGSCFPKDVSALRSLAEDIGYNAEMLNSILSVNKRQKVRIVEQLEKKLGSLQGKRVAVLGLAFNPETDDIRESPALDVIRVLKEQGAEIRAFDPQAIENTRKVHPDITYADNVRAALDGADACLILTDWEEFKSLGNDDFSSMRNKVIIEGRRVLNSERVMEFEGICW